MTRRRRPRIAPDRLMGEDITPCWNCGAELHPWRDAEPDDEAICGSCEEQRADCARDEAADRARDERWADGY